MFLFRKLFEKKEYIISNILEYSDNINDLIDGKYSFFVPKTNDIKEFKNILIEKERNNVIVCNFFSSFTTNSLAIDILLDSFLKLNNKNINLDNNNEIKYVIKAEIERYTIKFTCVYVQCQNNDYPHLMYSFSDILPQK